MFVSPTNLHCSQTCMNHWCRSVVFVSPTNLHCSQTTQAIRIVTKCLFPLRIYTALKLYAGYTEKKCGLFPLRIYTALKPTALALFPVSRLFPLRIYTALKPFDKVIIPQSCLFPLRIYTALKPQTSNCPRKISAKYLCNIPSFFRKHFYFNLT